MSVARQNKLAGILMRLRIEADDSHSAEGHSSHCLPSFSCFDINGLELLALHFSSKSVFEVDPSLPWWATIGV
jgi:hypothetical protein